MTAIVNGSWSILKDHLCFAFFAISRIIDLYNEVLSFTQKEGEGIGAAWSRYKQIAMSGPEFSIPEAMSMQHFVHDLSMKSVEYLDMISGGVLFNALLREGKSILEKILLVTSLEDLQLRAPELYKDVPIITYLDASDIPTSPVRAEFLQLSASELGSNKDIKDHTPSPLSIQEDLLDDDVGDMSKVPTYDIKYLNGEPIEQDLEEFMVAQENLLDLSAIISRDWTEDVEEDDNYIKI
jgi:hypothetical protein